MIKLLMFILGLALLALAFFTEMIPFGETFGVSNNLLAIIVGVVLILFAFWLWRRSRRTFGDISGMSKRQMRKTIETGRLGKSLMKGYA